MTIHDILTEEELERVQHLVSQGILYGRIREEFPALNRQQIPVFVDYYNQLVKDTGVDFGYKNEPYYTTEDVDELYPQYTWKELTPAEKAWYNIRVKNKRK